MNESALAAAAGLADTAVVAVPATTAGWIDTGVTVSKGQSVTLLATGAAALAGGPEDLTFPPQLFLCHRVTPDGGFDKVPAPTSTFVADRDGRLELIAHFPGAWSDQQGGLDGAWPRAAASGTYTVTVLAWRTDPADGLAALAPKDPSGLVRRERRRLLDPAPPPAGWTPLWRTGATEVFRDHRSSSGSWVQCRCEQDAGLIVHPVDVPLTERTRLRWHWRVLGLPSRVAEDTLLTHDYLSVAVEFDNGLDLTYLWSATLPVGTVFPCPLPWWNSHETHQVVRCGTADLGRWTDQEQPVLADYARAVGGRPPRRIVGVWLIAVSVFQAGVGECDVRGLELDGDHAAIALTPGRGQATFS